MEPNWLESFAGRRCVRRARDAPSGEAEYRANRRESRM
jgi:hypothetical protein